MIDDSLLTSEKVTWESRLGSSKEHPVIVVVDDPVRAFTLSAILTESGISNFSSCDGLAAIEMATLTPPRLLIADASLPGITGIQLATVIKRAIPDCDAILFAGLATLDDVRSSTHTLGHDFPILIRPVQPADLLSCVRERLATDGPRENSRDQNLNRLPIDHRLTNLSSKRFVA